MYRHFDKLLCVVASVLLPGLGQAYQKRWYAAGLYFFFTVLGYASGISFGMGFLVHAVCVVDAFIGGTKSEGGRAG